jgi:hypothetical protein
MSDTLKITEADDATPGQLREAEQRFRRTLEAALGDESLVAPVYRAYLRIVATYGEEPAPDTLTDAERAIFDQWQEAVTAAVAATFGPNRYMGDAMYEITLPS